MFWWNTASAAKPSSQRAFMTSRLPSGGCVDSVSRVGVDGEPIGVWGESAGGHLAAFVALNGNDERLNGAVGVTGRSSDVVAGVAWYPVTDFLALGSGSDQDGFARSDDAGSTPDRRPYPGSPRGCRVRESRHPTFTRAQRRSCWYTDSRTASSRLNRAH